MGDPSDHAINLVNAFIKASIAKDMRFMEQKLHANFLFTTPRGTLFTKSSFLSDFVSKPKFVVQLFKLLQQKVILINKIAILKRITKIRLQGQEEQYERQTFVLLMQKNKGTILNIQGTFTTQPE